MPATRRKGRRLIETRILKREPDGWVGLPYVWNDAQTEATLDVAGDTVNVSWIHTDGRPRTNNYIIPNINQCKGCHKSGEVMTPIGPKARHLNRDFAYREGKENQLPTGAVGAYWPGRHRPADAPGWPPGTTRRAARSTPAPAPGWRSTAPTATTPRARHETAGSTCSPRSSNPTAFGIFKVPVAAGLGLGRAAVRHRPRPARQIDPGLPDRLDPPGRHDARAGQAAGARGRRGAGPAVDRVADGIDALTERRNSLDAPAGRVETHAWSQIECYEASESGTHGDVWLTLLSTTFS